MNMSLAVLVEAAVGCLLLVTIAYCAVLERRIRSFRESQESLRGLVAELNAATARAESAVAGLATTTKAAEGALESRLREARTLSRTLALGNRPAPQQTRRSA